MKRVLVVVLLMLTMTAVVAGQSDPAIGETVTVSGTVLVRGETESILLPENSRIIVQLADLSRADAPAIVLSEAQFSNFVSLPVNYALQVRGDAIDSRLYYSVSASVYDANNNLLYTNDVSHTVLTQGYGTTTDVELIFVPRDEDTDVEEIDWIEVSGLVYVESRETITPLPDDSRLVILLEDVSRADASSIVLNEVIVEAPASLPISYVMWVDPAAIDSRMTYVVSARIVDTEGQLLYINDTMHPVLTQGASDSTGVQLIPVN